MEECQWDFVNKVIIHSCTLSMIVKKIKKWHTKTAYMEIVTGHRWLVCCGKIQILLWPFALLKDNLGALFFN